MVNPLVGWGLETQWWFFSPLGSSHSTWALLLAASAELCLLRLAGPFGPQSILPGGLLVSSWSFVWSSILFPYAGRVIPSVQKGVVCEWQTGCCVAS
jgi:hypothetical protein